MMRALPGILAAAAVLGAGAPARGQPAAPPESGAGEPEAAASPWIEQGTLEDARSNSVWLSPTALTNPGGTWALSDYEIVLLGVTFSPADRLELSAVMLPFDPLFVVFSGKLKLGSVDNLHFAAHGNFLGALGGGEDLEDFGIGTAGGVLTYCLDEACHSLLNLFAAAGFALEGENSSVPLLLSGGWVHRLGDSAKLMFEANTGFVAGEFNESAGGVLAFYGLRFTGRNAALDVGLGRPFCDGCGEPPGVFAAGYPWVAFTYRGGL